MDFIAGDVVRLGTYRIIITEVRETGYTYVFPYSSDLIQTDDTTNPRLNGLERTDHLDLCGVCEECGLIVDICIAYGLWQHGISGDRVSLIQDIFGEDVFSKINKNKDGQ